MELTAPGRLVHGRLVNDQDFDNPDYYDTAMLTHSSLQDRDHSVLATTHDESSIGQDGGDNPRSLPVTGAAHYVTLLERGYALHELTFAILFLLIVIIPLRAGQRWAWWACWTVLIAYLGYTFTFGVHDSTILARSLIGVIALPILLLAQMPALARHRAS